MEMMATEETCAALLKCLVSNRSMKIQFHCSLEPPSLVFYP